MINAKLPTALTGELLPAEFAPPNPSDALIQHRALIRAKTDEEAIVAWLAGCRSPKTLKAYKREAERLLFFCKERDIPLRKILYEDLLSFSAFLLAPPKEWIADAKYPRAHKDWRPMIGPLSPASHRMAITIIRKMLSWLTDAGYLQKNPGALLKLGRAPFAAEITRYLPVEAISLLDDAVIKMPEKTPAMCRQKARARFLVSLYYETGIRLFEGANACMGDFVREFKGDWWLHVTGKGETTKKPVPVSQRLLDDLKAYRIMYGKPPLPAPGDTEPLILKARGKPERVTEEAVGNAMQLIFRKAAILAREADQPELAYQLEAASTHWLRHSCMSHLLDDGTDLKTVQDIARHRSISTTGQYLHKRKEDIHAAVTRRSSKR